MPFARRHCFIGYNDNGILRLPIAILPGGPKTMAALRWILCLVILCSALLLVEANDKTPKPATSKPWFLQPVIRPPMPVGVTKSANPIDAFVAAQHRAKGLEPVGP